MYTVYGHPFSQHSRRVVTLLELAGLPYELVRVALDKGEHREPAYLSLNPNHQVPTLIDGDLTLHESNAILRYLANKHALTDLYPTEPVARARVDQWLDWNQCRVAPAVLDLVYNKMFAGPQADAAAIARGEERLRELTPILETALSRRDHVAGPRMTLADISVATNVSQLGLTGDAPRTASITRWFETMSALPAFQAALPKT